MNENKFKYASKEEQIKRANQIYANAYLAFLLGMSIIVITACIRDYRSVGYTVAFVGGSLAFYIAIVILNKNPKKVEKVKWVALVAVSYACFMTTYAFSSYYVRFGVVTPLIACMLYYDSKYMITTSVVICTIQIITTITKFIFGANGVDLLDITASTVVVIFFMILECFLERNGRVFQADMLGSLQEEKDTTESMMQDVIYVASEVRKGTENAMGIMNELNESTNVVTSAMKDISDSTLYTAENIQTQTVMTQNIQESIDETIARSEKMVKIAGESSELNNKNIVIMNEIMEQSNNIASINDNVVERMDALQEKANAVRGIADTIFNISSQTNLLALNASIESARAGEAGRGFAVVADEIRGLAEQTRAETESIAEILSELSENADKAAEAVESSRNATLTQEKLIEQASASFEEMNSNVSDLTANIEEIDQMLNSLAEANNQIVDNIAQLSATTEEVTASSAQAEGISNKNLENADNTKEILSGVLSVSQQLDKYIQE